MDSILIMNLSNGYDRRIISISFAKIVHKANACIESRGNTLGHAGCLASTPRGADARNNRPIAAAVTPHAFKKSQSLTDSQLTPETGERGVLLGAVYRSQRSGAQHPSPKRETSNDVQVRIVAYLPVEM